MDTILDRSAAPSLIRARMLIAGEWRDSASGEVIPVENPATKRTVGQVPRGGAPDVDRAVEAAARAFKTWRRVAPRDRGRMLTRIADVLEAPVEEQAWV